MNQIATNRIATVMRTVAVRMAGVADFHSSRALFFEAGMDASRREVEPW